jgi:hypothetical protein
MQAPALQFGAVSGQTLPQVPQLLGSESSDTHVPLHDVCPAGHTVHAPSVQYGVAPPQTLPHAPQLLGSESRKVHVLLQRTAPVMHE